MTPAPLARDCSSCDGSGRIAGRWCPVCAGRGWHPEVAQCIPGQRAGARACSSEDERWDMYGDTRCAPSPRWSRGTTSCGWLRLDAIEKFATMRNRDCPHPCTVTP